MEKHTAINNEWAAEDEEMAVVLDAGHIVATERHETLLNGHRAASGTPAAPPAVRSLFDEEMPAIGWGRLVHKQQKGLSRLVKANEMESVHA